MFAPKDGNCFYFLAVLGPDISHTLSKRNSDISWKPLGRRSTRNIFTTLAINIYLERITKITKIQSNSINKNKPKDTNNQSHWPSCTCAIVGDSMVILWWTVLRKNNYFRSMVTLKFFTFQVQKWKIAISKKYQLLFFM